MTQTFTALSALAGGFIGAYFTRQSQHHKWLLERRAESFANFLNLLNEARMHATKVLYDRTSDENSKERSTRLLEAYLPAMNYAKIVKLYLPRKLREEFYDCAKRFSILHTSPDLGDQRLQTMEKYSERIQQIFEDELSPYFWLRPFRRKIEGLTMRFKGQQGTGRHEK